MKTKNKNFIKFILFFMFCFAFFSCSDLIGKNLFDNFADDFSEENVFEVKGNFCIEGAIPFYFADDFESSPESENSFRDTKSLVETENSFSRKWGGQS